MGYELGVENPRRKKSNSEATLVGFFQGTNKKRVVRVTINDIDLKKLAYETTGRKIITAPETIAILLVFEIRYFGQMPSPGKCTTTLPLQMCQK